VITKVRVSAAEAVADIADGASVLVGGFAGGGTPFNLLDALIARGLRGLTVIGNSYFQVWPLVEAGCLRRLVSSFPAPRDPAQRERFRALHDHGDLEVEVVPQGTFAERIRAGGFGLPAFFSPVGVGTELASGKEVRRFGGRDHVLETALTADFALVKAWHADPYGNLDYHLAARNFNPAMAMAGRTTIAEVEALVALGDLDPAAVVTPGIFVDRVVPVPSQVAWTARGQRQSYATVGAVKDSTQPRFGGKPRLTRELVALRVIRELEPGMHVNLGTGIPTVIGNLLPPDSGVVLHSENGLLGYGRFADEAERDVDLVSATGEPVTLSPGACIMSSGEAFAMVRGRHLDLSVLGALQVAENGDLANWSTGHDAARGVGGAMDMVAGVGRVIVTMEHTTLAGAPKLVERCTLPLTGRGVVSQVATDLAWIEVTPEGFLLRELTPGWTFDEVQALTAARLHPAPNLREMEM
jgi:3-oxoacid CoA-transferase